MTLVRTSRPRLRRRSAEQARGASRRGGRPAVGRTARRRLGPRTSRTSPGGCGSRAGRWCSGAASLPGPGSTTSRSSVDEERRGVLTLERLLELVVDSDREVGLAIETKHPTRYAGLVEERRSSCSALRPRPPAQRARLADPGHVLLPAVDAPGPCAGTGPADRVPHGAGAAALPRRLAARSGARIAGPSIDIVRQHPRYVERAHRRAAGARLDRRRPRRRRAVPASSGSTRSSPTARG